MIPALNIKEQIKLAKDLVDLEDSVMEDSLFEIMAKAQRLATLVLSYHKLLDEAGCQ